MQYIKGHIPTIAEFGGKITFRSVQNTPILGSQNSDAIAIQEWPDAESFDRWRNSVEYRTWAEICDRATIISIIKCMNLD